MKNVDERWGRKDKHMAKSKKKKFSTFMVCLSAVMIILFSIAAIVLQFVTQIELSSTLITCWYTFWTGEIFALAGIKVIKVKHNYDDSEEDDDGNVG
ncbi:MAG: CD20-like domain-containing protein [Bacteroidaceae bacterium]|nr:CD20-like domain-containing protein [Bacteroidaceae bacterium]